MAKAHPYNKISSSCCGKAKYFLNLDVLAVIAAKKPVHPQCAGQGACIPQTKDAKPVSNLHDVRNLLQVCQLVLSAIHPADDKSEDVCIHVIKDHMTGTTCAPTYLWLLDSLFTEKQTTKKLWQLIATDTT